MIFSSTCNLRCLDCAAYKKHVTLGFWLKVSLTPTHNCTKVLKQLSEIRMKKNNFLDSSITRNRSRAGWRPTCTQSRHETSQLAVWNRFNVDIQNLLRQLWVTQNHAVHKDSCRSPPTWICGESLINFPKFISIVKGRKGLIFQNATCIHLKESIENMDFIRHHREKYPTTFPTHQQKKQNTLNSCWCLCQF